MALFCQGLDARFARQEQFLKDSFIDPMTATVNSLADQVGRMATKEEMGQLRSEITSQVQATGQLKQSFDTLYHHVYHCCLQPSAGNVIGILLSPFYLSVLHLQHLHSLYKTVLISADHTEPTPLQIRPDGAILLGISTTGYAGYRLRIRRDQTRCGNPI
jgi:hypothetical protein